VPIISVRDYFSFILSLYRLITFLW
jgi:hypothetical protein